jgi:glycosyltransferase involved in cell wall biosynthesis/ubiquinone/menaquinone biosynthesis C-methylase UbiE
MRICYFGTYEHDYPRNVMFLNGMRQVGVTVYECHEPIWQGKRDKTNVYRGLNLLKMLLRILRAYVRLIERYRHMPTHDILIVGYIGHLDMLLARLLASLRGIPLVFNVTLSLYDTFSSGRSLVNPHSLTGRAFWLIDFLSCHAADLVLNDTQTYADYFIKTFHLPPEKCCVVPLGANDRIFQAVEHQQKTTDICEVLFVGKFIPLHGCETIVRAASLLRDHPIHFTMIGDGQEYGLVQQLITELNLTNVTLTGWIDYHQLPAYFARADICLGNFGASARAGRAISNKVYESMAMKLAVLTGNTPGLRSELQPGEEVWVCEVADPQDLAQQLQTLAANPDVRNRIAQQGYTAYQQRYTLHAIGSRITRCLAKLDARMKHNQHQLVNTGERMLPNAPCSSEHYLAFLRHTVAYEYVVQHLSSASMVLDLGCGEGYGTHLLAQHARHVTGLDVELAVVAHAAHQYGSDSCLFGLYDGKTLPFNDHTLDVVVGMQVIEHVEHEHQFVAEIHRVLKPGGIFIATTPDRTYRLRPGQQPWNRFHIREYAAEDLQRVLAQTFAHVQVLHVCGSTEVYRIEWQRVQWARKIAALDWLKLREVVPEHLLPTLRTLLKTLTRQQKNTTTSTEKHYSTADFSIQEYPGGTSLDLLSVSRKATQPSP